ncbi:NAD-dependent epimerase/dehydratase family protein [Pseudomonas gingeri]|nr:NAD-dependent epimerase/dehydratase family protein [Pseudomonas gingeri]
MWAKSAPSPSCAVVLPTAENTLMASTGTTSRSLASTKDRFAARSPTSPVPKRIGSAWPSMARPFDETDWSDLTGDVWPYQKSKTLSERAAWEFIEQEGGALELSAVNPTAVLGPVLGPDYSHSIRMITNMLDGQRGCPKVNCGFVDVRDVADLHLRAMTHPAAKGERFLAIADESLWLIDVAQVLRRLGASASKVPTRELPNWLMRLAALRNPGLRGIATLLGRNMNATSEKAVRLLGWAPRSSEEAIVATAESLVQLGLLRH